jgi:hypothetical protein
MEPTWGTQVGQLAIVGMFRGLQEAPMESSDENIALVSICFLVVILLVGLPSCGPEKPVPTSGSGSPFRRDVRRHS